eukprot:919714-Amphidinium_carterae.1
MVASIGHREEHTATSTVQDTTEALANIKERTIVFTDALETPGFSSVLSAIGAVVVVSLIGALVLFDPQCLRLLYVVAGGLAIPAFVLLELGTPISTMAILAIPTRRCIITTSVHSPSKNNYMTHLL